MHGIISNGNFIKFEKESQRLRIGGDGGSWTINIKEIADKTINKFIYKTPKKTYEIESQIAYTKGFIRRFGGEAKLIVPVRYWNVN